MTYACFAPESWYETVQAPVRKVIVNHKLSSNLEEAANRAEVTALLIRCGYKVYHPEADTEGEDLVLRKPGGELIPVQLKARVYVSKPRYGGKDLWLLVPSGPFRIDEKRRWYLVPHDELYSHVEGRHGSSAPTWAGEWSYPYMPKHIVGYLAPFEVLPQQLGTNPGATD